MPPIPRVSGREIVRALRGAEWRLDRIRGSHHITIAPDERTVSVPVRGNQTLPVGTIGGIIEDPEMTVDEFVALLRRNKR
jgi:predicted RNA binding protein YcfA (HicA-like mRNA interferase family)